MAGSTPAIGVFSTYVEVIPGFGIKEDAEHSVLHVCGGDPCLMCLHHPHLGCSPRMWR